MSMVFTDKNRDELYELQKSYYKHLCDLIFEAIKSLSMNKKAIQKRFVIRNPELLERYYKEGRSAIMYAGHFGNWEWISFLPLQVKHQVTSFYQKLSNKYFDELVKIARERFDAICVESGKGVKSIISHEQQNILTINLIIGDQSPRKDSAMYWTDFLGHRTAFLVGADKIAQKANHVVMFPFFNKTDRGSYEIDFQVITEQPKEMNSDDIIESFASHLEKAILAHPQLWLWSHRRWKLSE
jgi:KDO2-lipid IV(A) lauroyltransferase